jgi:hypothetical protein
MSSAGRGLWRGGRPMKTRRLLIALAATAIAVIVISWVFYVRSTQVIELHIPLDTGNQTPGTLCKAEQVGNYAAPVLRALVWWARLPEPVSVHSGVKLYRLQYWTIRCDGAPTVASGLMGVPVRMPVRGVVSYQHGTNVNRHATPSRPSIGEGVLGAAVLAGGGYIFTAPDYIGLGTSREIHTYLHAESTANAVAKYSQCPSRRSNRNQARGSSRAFWGCLRE